MKKLLIFALVALMASPAAFAKMKVKLISGSLSELKGQQNVNVEFDFSKMSVGKFKNEADYVAKKTKDYNEKEAGKGDQWSKAWVEDRDSRFAPKFISLLNDNYSAGSFSTSGNNAVSLKVHTTFTEPGYNIGISRMPAVINADIYLMKDGKELAKVTCTGATGSSFGGFDYDTGSRIAEAYAYLGKYFGKYLAKMLKK